MSANFFLSEYFFNESDFCTNTPYFLILFRKCSVTEIEYSTEIEYGKSQTRFNLSSFLLGLAFFVYPVEVSEVSKTWSDIKNKINNKCRYLKKQTVTHLSSADSVVENVSVSQ